MPLESSRNDEAPRTRVLIVEDEALVAMDMEETLNTSGYDVVGVVDTQAAAIESAFRLEAEIVLMDITLRQGSGIAAAEALTANSQALVIFVSANSDPKTLAAAQATHPAGFIRKPFVAHELPALVADVLARARG